MVRNGEDWEWCIGVVDCIGAVDYIAVVELGCIEELVDCKLEREGCRQVGVLAEDDIGVGCRIDCFDRNRDRS